MINLLPTGYRLTLLYARRNTILKNWCIAFIIVLAGAVLLVAGGYVFLQSEINKQSKALETSRQDLASQDIEGTRQRLDEISANTKLVLQVLQKEILFSKLLRQLGASLPPNTALTQVQIDEVKGGLTLQASAADINAATQLQVNLQDPNNKIFEKADIENINCGEEGGGVFPCTVQLRALFAEENPYVYIPSSQTSANSQENPQ
jgi:Tfp pilus assembly protein PilN